MFPNGVAADMERFPDGKWKNRHGNSSVTVHTVRVEFVMVSHQGRLTFRDS